MSNNNQKPFSGAYSQRRFSDYTAKGSTEYTVQCASGEPEMGIVRLEVENTSVGLTTASTSQISTNRDGSLTCPSGTWLKATAEPKPGYRFVQWQTNIGSDGGSTKNYNNNPLGFKVVKNTWLTARFEKSSGNGTQTRTVQVQWNGVMGNVTCTSPLTYEQGSPANAGSVNVASGDMITLTATPRAGYHFVKWQGVPIAGKTAQSVPFNVNSNYNIVALFAADDNSEGGGNGGNGGGNGGNGGNGGGNGHVVDTPEQPPVDVPGNGGGNVITTTDDLTGKAVAFAKKYWWAIAIAIYLYYNSKKGGSK